MSKSIHKFKLRMLKKMTFLPAKIYIPYMYEYFTGKKLDLYNPIEFNQKIQWYKVFYQPEELTNLVDKYSVREYVKEKIGEQYLNELYHVYDKVAEINFDELPNEFIIKATHGCGYNLIVNDKSTINKFKTKLLFHKWLNTSQYYRTGKEWAYKNIKKRLIVEKLLNEEGQPSLIDYKFYCFNGKPKFLGIYVDRAKTVKNGFYDTDFNKLPFSNKKNENTIDTDIEKPSTFEEMILLSEKLADKFPFVRVDFYSIKGKITFGEMTFYPGDGRRDFTPEKYNTIIGDYLKLPEIPKGKKRITEV